MSDTCQQAVRCSPEDLREALSIHTRKITDSCRDKDCIEDLRVYLTQGSQAILDTAAGAKVRCADLLYTYIDVEPVAFDRNHYCIDVTFYYRILADATIGTNRPAALYGLAVFSKRAVLCGEDSHHLVALTVGIGDDTGNVFQSLLIGHRSAAKFLYDQTHSVSFFASDWIPCVCSIIRRQGAFGINPERADKPAHPVFR